MIGAYGFGNCRYSKLHENAILKYENVMGSNDETINYNSFKIEGKVIIYRDYFGCLTNLLQNDLYI